MKRVIQLAFVLFLVNGGASAQSLDELPPAVAKISKAMVRQCTKAGGKASYEPLELVTSVFFGESYDGGGRESFVIDGSKLYCKGGKASGKSCSNGECRLIVVDPSGSDGYRVDFDATVQAWGLSGEHAAEKGPNAILELIVGGDTYQYRIDGRGLNKIN